MGLAFYDSTQTVFSAVGTTYGPQRTHHDGKLGGADERIVYLRNDDPTKWYSNITVSLELDAYGDVGEFGTTGWSIKFLYGERRPTEAEWDLVRSGDSIEIPDIGTEAAADTSTYHPLWIRVYCPGGESAQIRENQRLRLFAFKRNVGE
jgi:hypothetical protein